MPSTASLSSSQPVPPFRSPCRSEPLKQDKLSLSQLELLIPKAADILRARVDASEFKAFIFGMLFLKRLSDECVIKQMQDYMLHAIRL